MMKVLCYSELRRYKTFEERFKYLQLKGVVGRSTFGFDRYINQRFYTSTQWKKARRDVILRDNGCDLGIEDRVIHDRILIHHMNPMTMDALEQGFGEALDPEFLICVTHPTHNAIHYGDESLLASRPKERSPGDTSLWAPIGGLSE